VRSPLAKLSHQKAWESSGLFPFNPKLVLDRLPHGSQRRNEAEPRGAELDLERLRTAGNPIPPAVQATPITVADIQALDQKVERLEDEVAGLKVAFQLVSKAAK
jgi:hypothetical protein